MAKFRKGQNVTAAAHLFMGVVLDVNTTYVVELGDGSRLSLSAEEQKSYPDARVVETVESYLVERNWDGVGCWMTPDSLEAGHQTVAVAK